LERIAAGQRVLRRMIAATVHRYELAGRWQDLLRLDTTASQVM